MRTFVSLLLLAGCLSSCAKSGIKQIQVQNIEEIVFRPIGGTPGVITNSAELKLIAEWFNESVKVAPISRFSTTSYPKPGHSVTIRLKSGESQRVGISGGAVMPSGGQNPKPGCALRLTILDVEGTHYLLQSCPEPLLFPRPAERLR